jgi:hypothetical protein
VTVSEIRRDPVFSLAISECRRMDAIQRFCDLRGYPQDEATTKTANIFVDEELVNQMKEGK